METKHKKIDGALTPQELVERNSAGRGKKGKQQPPRWDTNDHQTKKKSTMSSK
jgi:hypothetical protein